MGCAWDLRPQREKWASVEEAMPLCPSFRLGNGCQTQMGEVQWINRFIYSPTEASHILREECRPVPHGTHYLSPHATFRTAVLFAYTKNQTDRSAWNVVGT